MTPFPWARPVEGMLALSAIELIAACASVPSAAPAIAAGAASIEAARASGAADYAAVYLSTAQSKLDRAQVLAHAGSHRDARRMAEQADVDAQFARALAGASRSQRSMSEIEANLRTLREQLAQQRPAAVTSPVAPPPITVPAAPPGTVAPRPP